MRVTGLIVLGLVALACQGAPCAAQDAPPDKAGASDAKDVGRVGSLSPDEARRAARARARAAGAAPVKTAIQAKTETRAKTATPVKSAAPAVEVKSATRVQHAAKTVAPSPIRKADAPRPAPKVAAMPARPVVTRERAETRSVEVGARSRAPRREIAQRVVRRVRPPVWRAYAGDPMRGPRVGDVIPPGVPLYPLPPRFGPPPGAMESADEP